MLDRLIAFHTHGRAEAFARMATQPPAPRPARVKAVTA